MLYLMFDAASFNDKLTKSNIMLTRDEYKDLLHSFFQNKKVTVLETIKNKLSSHIIAQFSDHRWPKRLKEKIQLLFYIIYSEAISVKANPKILNDCFLIIQEQLAVFEGVDANLPQIKEAITRLQNLLTQGVTQSISIPSEKRNLSAPSSATDVKESFQEIVDQADAYITSGFVHSPETIKQLDEKQVVTDAVLYQPLVERDPGSIIVIASLNAISDDTEAAEQLVQSSVNKFKCYATMAELENHIHKFPGQIKETKTFGAYPQACVTAIRTMIYPDGAVHYSGFCIGNPMLFIINNKTNLVECLKTRATDNLKRAEMFTLTGKFSSSDLMLTASGEALKLLNSSRKQFTLPTTSLRLSSLRKPIDLGKSILVKVLAESVSTTVNKKSHNTTIAIFSEQWFFKLFALEQEEKPVTTHTPIKKLVNFFTEKRVSLRSTPFASPSQVANNIVAMSCSSLSSHSVSTDEMSAQALPSPLLTRISVHEPPKPSTEEEKPKSDKYAMSIPITPLEKSTSSITSGILLDASNPFAKFKATELKPELAAISLIQTGSTYFSNNPKAKNENKSGNYLRVEYISGLPCPQVIDFGRNTTEAPISRYDLQFRQKIPDFIRISHSQLSGVNYDPENIKIVIKRLIQKINTLIKEHNLPGFSMIQGITFIDRRGTKHLVGFGIGDIMMVLEKKKTDEEKSQLITVCSARNIFSLSSDQKPDDMIQNFEMQSAVFPTAQPRSQLPQNDWETQAIIFDMTVESDDMIHVLTNGMWNFLPVKVTSQIVSNGVCLLDSQLDPVCSSILTETIWVTRMTQIAISEKNQSLVNQKFSELQNEYDRRQAIIDQLKESLSMRIKRLNLNQESQSDDNLSKNLTQFDSFINDETIFDSEIGETFKHNIDQLKQEIELINKFTNTSKESPTQSDIDAFDNLMHTARYDGTLQATPIKLAKTHAVKPFSPNMGTKLNFDEDKNTLDEDDGIFSDLVGFRLPEKDEYSGRSGISFSELSREHDPLTLCNDQKQKKAEIMFFHAKLNQIIEYEQALIYSRKQMKDKQFFELGNNADYIQMQVPNEVMRKSFIEQAVLQQIKITVMESHNELFLNAESNKRLVTFSTFHQEIQKCVTLLNAEQILANYLGESIEKTHETMIKHFKNNAYLMEFYGLDKSQAIDDFKMQLLKKMGISAPLDLYSNGCAVRMKL